MKFVPKHLAKQIHEVWRTITLGLELVTKCERHRVQENIKLQAQSPLNPLLPEIPEYNLVRVMHFHCTHSYPFFQWYDMAMTIASMGGDGPEPMDLGVEQDDAIAMIKVARNAYETDKIVRALMDSKSFHQT